MFSGTPNAALTASNSGRYSDYVRSGECGINLILLDEFYCPQALYHLPHAKFMNTKKRMPHIAIQHVYWCCIKGGLQTGISSTPSHVITILCAGLFTSSMFTLYSLRSPSLSLSFDVYRLFFVFTIQSCAPVHSVQPIIRCRTNKFMYNVYILLTTYYVI